MLCDWNGKYFNIPLSGAIYKRRLTENSLWCKKCHWHFGCFIFLCIKMDTWSFKLALIYNESLILEKLLLWWHTFFTYFYIVSGTHTHTHPHPPNFTCSLTVSDVCIHFQSKLREFYSICIVSSYHVFPFYQSVSTRIGAENSFIFLAFPHASSYTCTPPRLLLVSPFFARKMNTDEMVRTRISRDAIPFSLRSDRD